LTRRFRALHPRSIIIGTSSTDVGEEFLTIGANDFLQKPFLPLELVYMLGHKEALV
jgi:DNA-binding response OmpR family regulator